MEKLTKNLGTITDGERLNYTLKGTSSGTFIHDFSEQRLYLDELATQLLGVDKQVIGLEEWFERIHPLDLEKTQKILFA